MAMFQLSSSEIGKKPDHPASQHLSAQGASARSFPCTATKTWPKESQKKAFPNLRSGEHEFGDHQNAWTGKPRSWETKRISMCLPQVVFKKLLFILFRFLDQWYTYVHKPYWSFGCKSLPFFPIFYPKKLGNHSAKKIAFTNSGMKDLNVAFSVILAGFGQGRGT